MKKLVVLLCAALLTSGLLVGCGNDGNTDNPGNNTQQAGTNEGIKADGFAFAYKGTDIIPNAKMEPVVAALC